jgi:hypothetical protein
MIFALYEKLYSLIEYVDIDTAVASTIYKTERNEYLCHHSQGQR